MTLSKLARLANVSVSVVSKAFSGRDDVSEEMRERVFAVAREHGCFQQFYHVPYDKPVVAVIFPELISQYYMKYLEILKDRLEENGYTVLLSISNFDAQMEDELINYYIVHTKVDALITFGNRSALPSDSETALISFSSGNNEFGCHIHRNITSGMSKAFEYLKNSGHTRVAFVGEPLTLGQQDIFTQTAKEYGFDTSSELSFCSLHRFHKAGEEGARYISSLDNRPTAVFCAYGYISQGLLSEFESLGIRVPEDISVISMDNNPSPLATSHDIAYIPSLIEDICEKSVELLGERIHSKNPNAPHTVILEPEFYVGNTVKILK